MSNVAKSVRSSGARLLLVIGLVGGLAGLVVGCSPPDEPTGHRAPGGSSTISRLEVSLKS